MLLGQAPGSIFLIITLILNYPHYFLFNPQYEIEQNYGLYYIFLGSIAVHVLVLVKLVIILNTIC